MFSLHTLHTFYCLLLLISDKNWLHTGCTIICDKLIDRK